MAECLLPKQNVAGSNPVSRSTFSIAPASAEERGIDGEATIAASSPWCSGARVSDRQKLRARLQGTGFCPDNVVVAADP